MMKSFTKYGCLLTLGLLGAGFGTFAQAPANDDCSGAVSLTVGTTCTPVNGTTTNATGSTGIPDPGCGAGSSGWDDDVWYSFTPAAGQTTVNIAFTSISGEDDMVAQLYTSSTGDCNGNFALADCSDDDNGSMPGFSLITVTPGTTYYIRVFTYATGASGDFSVCVSVPPPPPANDDCAGAVALTASATITCGGVVSGTTESATHSNETASSANDGGTNDDVWYTFVASGSTQKITLSNLNGPATDMSMAVYSGSCGTLTEIQYSDPETMVVSGLTAGTTYYLRVWTYSDAAGDYASFDVCVTNAIPPANDNCTNAVAITPSTLVCTPVSGTTENATHSNEVASSANDNGTDDDVWYSFVASASSQIIDLTNINGSTDMSMAVYSGSCGALTEIQYSDPETMTVAGLTAGTTYYLRVWTYSSTAGNYASFDVCILAPPPPVTNDLPADAITVPVDQPCSTPYYNNGATVATGEPGALCTGAAENYATVWFKFTAPASGAVRITTDFAGYLLEDTRIALFSVGNVADYSTFQSLACDEDNGVLGDGYNSVLYATGLTAGADYYIVVDQYDNSTAAGTFCLEVSTLTDAMLPAAGACTEGQSNFASDEYKGWVSLVDEDGKLIANVKPNAATTSLVNYSITPSFSIHQGSLRQDANGLAYLNRNSFYEASLEDVNGNQLPGANMDLQLFFTSAELMSLGTPLSGLNVTHSPGVACSENATGDGSQTALIASGNGSSGNASWINITTPGFSNFYLMNGTTPLPIDLKSITAANAGSSNRVDWSTAKEDAGEYFELERSADSKTFRFLAKVNGKGAAAEYTYWDQAPLAGTSYYRLKMVNNDGKVVYSKVVSATVTDKAGFSFRVSPNPVQHTVNVSLKGDRAANATLVLTDVTGKTLRTYTVSGEEISMDMSSLSQGLYLLRYTDDNRKETLKISKQ
ncbi:T9SS type A sorting domain-containing protein [Taibaiella helva]|uniref:T9SS type A sorting domain-containing protein n=1 Tax=Taibaiella helva TaxID=2301235 RepID=UPI000E58B8AF|nr:T9SS type A sorting domain-containing protein [Taibaiella helva]